MPKNSLSKYHYLLTKLMLILAAVIAMASFLMAGLHYQGLVRTKIQFFDETLYSLKHTYIYELIRESERQLQALCASLDVDAIQRGESAFNTTWPIVHQIKMEDKHYIYFYNAKTQKLDSFPSWEIPEDYDPTTRPWYQLLTQGTSTPTWIGPYKEYNSSRTIISLGMPVFSETNETLGILLVDMSLDTIAATFRQISEHKNVSLFLRDKSAGQMISISNGITEDIKTLKSNKYPLAWYGLVQGVLMTEDLGYLPWELGLYIPTTTFLEALMDEFYFSILPMGAMLLVVGVGIYSLLRIFKQELRFVERRLELYKNRTQRSLMPGSSQAWFVEKSLEKIEKQYRSSLRVDPLAGVFNRRAFDEDIERQCEQKLPFCLVLIDIDNFKQVNDNYGHLFGDAVLKRVAALLQEEVGEDSVYRIGGDEFACILDTSKPILRRILSRINKRMVRTRWREPGATVTLSLGATTQLDSEETMFMRADQALYNSKNNGRNCWSLYE